MKRIPLKIKIKYLIPLLLIGGFVGCSEDALHFEEEGIEITVADSSILVNNRSDRPIYYFTIARKETAMVDWIPVSEKENKIEAHRTQKIVLTDIYGFEKKGDEIVFYYWPSKSPDSKDIHNILVKTG